MRALTFCLLLLPLCCASQELAPQHRIAVAEAGANYEVTVPLSRLVMVVPKGTLSRDQGQGGGSMDSPRYFRFHDPESGAILSGWFEPANRRVPLKQSLKVETDNLQRSGFGEPLELEEGSIGGMQVFSYFLPIPDGTSAHIRASYVAADTWVDLHASVTAGISRQEAKQRVAAFVRSISFREKP